MLHRSALAQLVEHRTCDRIVASSNPSCSGGKIIFSRVNFFMLTLIRCPFLPRYRNGTSFCQKCKWQFTGNTHTPTAQRSRSGLTVLSGMEIYQENELTRNSSGNTRPQSSQLAEPLWIDPGLKSGISVRELISTKKNDTNK